MARVLLTSVVRPFGGPGEGDSVGAELFHAQVTRAQGAFSMRQVIRVWGLDLIAENIDAPAVVLHYPSMAELERELRGGGYTHVGINFVVATFHKVRAMVRLVRRVSPGSRIVLGGYGTVLPDDMLLPYADAVCREEGVQFMRRLLGEEVDRPVRAAHSPVPSTRVLGWQQPSVVGLVAAGLGCANGCDFCCTSHFFRRKYVPLRASGAEIYETMMDTRRRAEREGQQMDGFALIDEDFFLYKKRAEEFLEHVRRGGESLSIFGFGSVKGLSQFRASEIAEMGFDLIWTAFEGKRSGYKKLQGRPIDELHQDLHRHGVGTLASMIIGFPYQDERTIRAEFEELMALEPALVQILIYFAFPGTPFFDQVLAEGRYLPQYQRGADLRRWDGFAMHMKHDSLTPDAVERLQRDLYAEDFRRLGASVHRLARIWLRGVRTLEGSPSPLLRARAERLLRTARGVRPTLGPARLLLPRGGARHRAREVERELEALCGSPTWKERVFGQAAFGLGALTETVAGLGLLQQPSLLRIEHRTGHDASAPPPQPVMRLHGLGRPLLSRFLEDVADRIAGPVHAPEDTRGPAGGWAPVAADRRSLAVHASCGAAPARNAAPAASSA